MRAQPSRRSSTATGSPRRSSVTRSASSLGCARTAATSTEQRTSMGSGGAFEQLPEGGVLPELADRDERVALLDNVGRLGSRDGLGLTQDRDHRDSRPGAEAAFGERLPNTRALFRHGNPFDRELAERQLELLDDLRPLVGAADDGPELARLVVVEPDHGGGLVVRSVGEEVDLPVAVVVQADREPSASGRPEAVLDADPRQTGLSQIYRH